MITELGCFHILPPSFPLIPSSRHSLASPRSSSELGAGDFVTNKTCFAMYKDFSHVCWTGRHKQAPEKRGFWVWMGCQRQIPRTNQHHHHPLDLRQPWFPPSMTTCGNMKGITKLHCLIRHSLTSFSLWVLRTHLKYLKMVLINSLINISFYEMLEIRLGSLGSLDFFRLWTIYINSPEKHP